MENKDRNKEWKRNQYLEERLALLSNVLSNCVPEDVCANLPEPQCIFIVGAPRSGTTLLLQWLAQTQLFAYPSNVISRFWRAPYVGELIQQILLDSKANFRGEFDDIQSSISKTMNFESELGKTNGALSANEFWYFWRQFGTEPQGEDFSFNATMDFDFINFGKNLSAWNVVSGAPVSLKSMIINWHIREFAEHYPKCLFLYIKRNPVDTMLSLLRARQNYFGSTASWYSFKVPGYERLTGLTAEEQVAAQVAAHDRDIPVQLAKIPKSQFIETDYEAFCDNPHELLGKITRVFDIDMRGSNIELRSTSLAPRVRKSDELPDGERNKLKEYYLKYKNIGAETDPSRI